MDRNAITAAVVLIHRELMRFTSSSEADMPRPVPRKLGGTVTQIGTADTVPGAD
jgi:hypothetical protein